MEARSTHFSPSMRRVYSHTRGLALQLGLSMDGPIITESTIVSGKEDLCTALLGKVQDKFEGGQISINWLKDNFDELPKDQTEVIK
ncbi:hypothetical protein J1N35_014973 [Gossypium stocksii]|uniref:Uncharacterized protein n=1 Tax=Gossypium stocksii TaxID=47602 RepID=A0A9D3VVL6_9ROSI|nr:hypothetical protein J1N35_014973 [Gossypium stocksii]